MISCLKAPFTHNATASIPRDGGGGGGGEGGGGGGGGEARGRLLYYSCFARQCLVSKDASKKRNSHVSVLDKIIHSTSCFCSMS